MEANEALAIFVKRVVVSAKADRYASLANSKKGRSKVLDALCHKFEGDVRSEAVKGNKYCAIWGKPCFVFHYRKGFGIEYESVREAYDELSAEDSWLILLSDGSKGIYRPEDRWDAEVLLER